MVQRYLDAPLLLDGLKFDLRLYVLLTSVGCGEGHVGGGGGGGGGDADEAQLLRAFVCREGMVRFAVTPYSGAGLHKNTAHLTNYSLNSKVAGFTTDGGEYDGGEHGSKRTLSSVFAALEASGQVPSVDALWRSINTLICRALAVIQPTLAGARPLWGVSKCARLLDFRESRDDSSDDVTAAHLPPSILPHRLPDPRYSCEAAQPCEAAQNPRPAARRACMLAALLSACSLRCSLHARCMIQSTSSEPARVERL